MIIEDDEVVGAGGVVPVGEQRSKSGHGHMIRIPTCHGQNKIKSMPHLQLMICHKLLFCSWCVVMRVAMCVFANESHSIATHAEAPS